MSHSDNFIKFYFSGICHRRNTEYSDARGKYHQLDLRHTFARNKLSVASRIDSLRPDLVDTIKTKSSDINVFSCKISDAMQSETAGRISQSIYVCLLPC